MASIMNGKSLYRVDAAMIEKKLNAQTFPTITAYMKPLTYWTASKHSSCQMQIRTYIGYLY